MKLRVLFPLLAAMTLRAAQGDLPPETRSLGVNLAGAEFGKLPGRAGTDYAYPGAASFDYFRTQGMALIRVPFKWERVQPVCPGPLDAAELARLDAAVALARERGMKLLLDLHNYAHFNSRALGTPELPDTAFAEFWRLLAAHYAGEDAVFAYGLMNEPNKTQGRWPASAQAAIDAIRTVDSNHVISVCGEGWSGAHCWKKVNTNLNLRDPAGRLLYEAHQYFDRDNSGTYKQSYDDSGAHPEVGVERLRPFLQWLEEHHAQGFIGEFGVPGDDPRWLEVLDRFLAAMKKNGLGGTYWAAGSRWGNYPLSVEPEQGQDRPQMAALALYAGDRVKPADLRTEYEQAAERMRAAGQRVIYNFRSRAESYHFKNPESEFASSATNNLRKLSFRHAGTSPYVGVGLYFGALSCTNQRTLVFPLRADKPVGVTVKAHTAGHETYTGRLQVSTNLAELTLPLEQLAGSKGTFDRSQRIEKIELQPDAAAAGNALYAGAVLLER